MDSTADLPPIFKKHGYFLLPVINGRYAIVRGNGFLCEAAAMLCQQAKPRGGVASTYVFWSARNARKLSDL
jgi:hypothetical protein